MPRWEKGKRFTTLVARNETLLVTTGPVGREGKSELLRFPGLEGKDLALTDMAARIEKLEAEGWKKVGFVIDPNAKPSRDVIVPASDATRRLEHMFKEALYDEKPPGIEQCADLFTEWNKLRFSAEERTWTFSTENVEEPPGVHVTLSCTLDGSGDSVTTAIYLIFPPDEEVEDTSIERKGTLKGFLERARAKAAWELLANAAPEVVEVGG